MIALCDIYSFVQGLHERGFLKGLSITINDYTSIYGHVTDLTHPRRVQNRQTFKA